MSKNLMAETTHERSQMLKYRVQTLANGYFAGG
jgi:hypothetical protein